MKKIIRFSALLLLSMIGLAACEKDVVLDLADRQGAFIIVEANITDSGDSQWLRLSFSSSYYEQSDGEGISDAEVFIENIDNPTERYIFFPTPIDSLKGYYYNDHITFNLQDKRFRLNINYSGHTYTAESQWKPLPVIDSLSMHLNAFTELGFFPDTLYDLKVHFSELPQPEDYYLFNMYINDTLRTYRPTDKSLISDENLTDYVSLSVMTINQEDLRPGDSIIIEMRSISRENYDFYNIFFIQTDLSGNPFAGAPPANIPTNLSHGAKGFFQISAVQKQTIAYKPTLK